MAILPYSKNNGIPIPPILLASDFPKQGLVSHSRHGCDKNNPI